MTSLNFKVALPTLYFTLHTEIRYILPTIVFWRIGALKSIANFANLNVYSISMKFTWWPTFGEMRPWMDRG